MQVIGRVLRNPWLRRVELAYFGFGAGEYGVWVAVLVYAYQRGGTTTAAVVAVIQLIPAAVVAPLAARLADRVAGRALTTSYALQAGSLALTAAAFLAGAPAPVGYLCATCAATAVTLTRPAQGALLPRLVRTPSELTAANALSGWVESSSFLVGPALTGLLIALGGPGLAVGGFAAVLLAGTALVQGAPSGETAAGAALDGGEPAGGIRAVVAANRPVTALLGLLCAVYVVEGTMDIMVVVLAIHTLRLSASGPGYLAAMFGVGSVLGGMASVALVGRPRMSAPLLGAATAWGLAFVALGAARSVAPAFLLIAVAGVGRTILDVSGRTLMHRAVPPDVHGRMFGALEGLAMAGLAVGSLSVPALVALGGPMLALSASGSLLIAVAAGAVGAVRRLDDGSAVSPEALRALRACPIFAALPPPPLEDLARAVIAVDFAPGERIVGEGDRGDRFYLLRSGRLEVTVAGDHVRDLGPGASFGEIALLRDGIRTATVTVGGGGPAELYALERAAFLTALSGSARAARAAEEIVTAHINAAVG